MLANERRTIRSDQLEKKKEVPEARGGEGKGERERERRGICGSVAAYSLCA